MVQKTFSTISQKIAVWKKSADISTAAFKSAGWHNNSKPLCLLFPAYQCPEGFGKDKQTSHNNAVILYPLSLSV